MTSHRRKLSHNKALQKIQRPPCQSIYQQLLRQADAALAK
jgi:hypothetical protein